MWQTTAFSTFSPLAEQFALQESDLLIRPSDFRDLNPVGCIQRGKNNMCRSHLTTVTCPKQLSDSGYKYNYFAVDWFEKHRETMSLDINNELDKEKGSSASCCGTVAVRWSYYYHHLQMYFHKVANINTTRYTWFTFRLLSVLSKLADGYARHALVLSLVYIHLCKHDITEIIRWKQFFFSSSSSCAAFRNDNQPVKYLSHTPSPAQDALHRRCWDAHLAAELVGVAERFLNDRMRD